MTAPSQTPEAAGLEVVGQAGAMPGTSGFTMAAFRADEVPVGTVIVTAASAQARIAEERALFKSLMVRKNFYKENMKLAEDRATAAEARADRLAEIASKLGAAISWLDYPFIDNRTPEAELRQRVGFMMKDAEPHRAALQQETQP